MHFPIFQFGGFIYADLFCNINIVSSKSMYNSCFFFFPTWYFTSHAFPEFLVWTSHYSTWLTAKVNFKNWGKNIPLNSQYFGSMNPTLLGYAISQSSWKIRTFVWEIQLVHSEGDQPWDFFGRNDAEAVDKNVVVFFYICLSTCSLLSLHLLIIPLSSSGIALIRSIS